MSNDPTRDALAAALDQSTHPVRLSDHIEQLRTRDIIIYGAGAVGRYACSILQHHGLAPQCFFDQKGATEGAFGGIPILPLEQDRRTKAQAANTTVIMCVLCRSEVEVSIQEALRSRGYSSIIPFRQKAFSTDFIRAHASDVAEPPMQEYRSEILRCFDLLGDDASRRAYGCAMGSFARRNFDDMPFLPVSQQYMPPDIALSKGYSSFVDCGAFTGDTIANLVAAGRTPRATYAFEPDQRNYRALAATAERLNLAQCVLFPCGVSSQTATLRFKTDGTYAGAASVLDPAGNSLIQCVALDEALKGIAPSMIKMDIEGAEIDALNGARSIIARHRPDLAICVYHYVDHYFDIPLLINSWNLGYRFYFRTYDSCGNESVLYATGA
jgi:FkbM family methyltransferase